MYVMSTVIYQIVYWSYMGLIYISIQYHTVVNKDEKISTSKSATCTCTFTFNCLLILTLLGLPTNILKIDFEFWGNFELRESKIDLS